MAAGIAHANDGRKPAFLESGDNDLIRFQMGDTAQGRTPEAADRSLEVSEHIPVISPSTAPSALKEPGTSETRANAAPKQLNKQQSETLRSQREPIATAVVRRQASGRIVPAAPGESQARVPERERRERLSGPATSGRFSDTASGALQLEAPEEQALDSFQMAEPAPAPIPEPTPVLPEGVDARLVTVCLNNPNGATGAKAFDIRREGPPRYVADVGASACARFEPTRHTLYLWKTNDIGALSLILSNRMDLNGEDGTQVTLDWIRDR
ncbi:hypothetical protein [uncultured Roseibium sp.]|uniref:hypothetical protein n=1 Tax=uncultured Roseibium sp. TaxID=1936171 RepID=UPI0026323A9B|nr:hypothetical protein [uncultured Roseibium sp.]